MLDCPEAYSMALCACQCGRSLQRNISVQPLSEESPLWLHITQKQVEITCSVITKIPQSLDIIAVTKCCYKKQVHLCWWFAGVHFSRVRNDSTWTYKCKYTCSSLVKLCHTFFFATSYKNTGIIIFRYLSNLIFEQNWIGGVRIRCLCQCCWGKWCPL